VIIASCDRPSFLPVALECYRRQTYPSRELIVVDDGQLHPVDPAAVEAVGGRLLRLARRTALGTKLNLGVEAASGRWCLKIDDDDFYAPSYISTLVQTVEDAFGDHCRPTLAFMAPFVFFDLQAWRTRIWEGGGTPGATLLFAKEDWRERPFRPISFLEDVAYVAEQVRLGVTPMPVWKPGGFVIVRHGGFGGRGHSWTRHVAGPAVEDHIRALPEYGTPETLMPEWAIARYRAIRATQGASSSIEIAEPQWSRGH
jgi:Glycosyl transferase family 2